MPLKDIFYQLKSITLGTTTTNVDSKLDSAIKDITSFRSESGRNGYIDLIKHLITKGSVTLDQFSQASPTPAVMGQGARISRYKAYEAITTNISYCNRALNVLVDNILSPDDITKTSLEVKPKEFLDGDTKFDTDSKDVTEIIEKLKLEERLDLIVKNTLHFGDFFCEIADAKTALTSKSSFLSENLFLESPFIHNKKNTEELSVTFSESESESLNEVKILMDYSSLNDVKIDNLTELPNIPPINKKNKKDILNTYLLYYDPKRIVKLQSELFPLCFGYLVFPSTSFAPHLMIQNQIINTLCQKILKNIESKIPGMKSEEIDQKDLKSMISQMISEGDSAKIMNIRYVPPDRMQHFSIPTTKYYPYGESIFDSCQFSAKLLIALETALTISRINRSTEKRKISVEIGLPRDARKLVEKLKEEFRKRKISVDSFGSVDTIPSMINTFEDVYVPQKDGKSYVDISTFNEGTMDVRSKVDELKLIRDQLIASLGVPPSFLGIEENLSNKCISLKSLIKLLNGKDIELQSLIDEFNETGTIDDKWTYSYDNKTGKLVHGKIIWAGITRKNTQVIKITIDNGEFEIATPDHHFMLDNGEYIKAEDLKIGDSLMSYMENLNYKIISIEVLEEIIDTGDITVEKYHNFSLSSGIIISNSALSEENILFARTIVNYQKFLSHQISDLIRKVYKIIDPEKELSLLDNVMISFSPPRSLQFERQSKYLGDLANLIETLERIGIPKEWSKKRYLTDIDWLDVKKYEIDQKIETDLKLQDEPQDTSMGGIGGMAGIGGMGGGTTGLGF